MFKKLLTVTITDVFKGFNIDPNLHKIHAYPF